MKPPRILYCNCTYAQVVPPEVKAAVLKDLSQSNRSFEAVADLCEMSARRDPVLRKLVEGGSVKIAACYPRAVKWLFSAAGAPLDLEKTEVLNMRVQTDREISDRLNTEDLQPNLPKGKETREGEVPQAAAA